MLFFQTYTPELKIGAVVLKEDIDKFSTYSLILHNGELKPSIEKKISGISYRIAYETENNRIVQISTADPNFETSDGVRPGSYIEATREQILVTKNSDILGPKTKDGWETVLGTDFEIVILKNGNNERIGLRDEKSGLWSARKAMKRIRESFAGSRTIKVKIDRFSKQKE